MAPKRRKLIPKTVRNAPEQQHYLVSFCDYIRNECLLAENTCAAYRRDLERFYLWLGDRAIRELRIQELSDYAAWLHEKNLAPASLARHVVSLRVFFRFLQLEGFITTNQAELLGSQKLWDRMPSVMSPGQVDQLLRSPTPEKDRLWIRDRALLEMYYATGARASEITGLKLHDVHLDGPYCRFTGKGNKQRDVPLGEQAIAAFELWMSEQRPELIERMEKQKRKSKATAESTNPTDLKRQSAITDFAFFSARGLPLKREAIWELVKKYALRIGAPSDISPHSLRHSFATHMLAGGADIRQVQVLLGHANITTTEIYTHVDLTALKELHKKFHPRG